MVEKRKKRKGGKKEASGKVGDLSIEVIGVVNT